MKAIIRPLLCIFPAAVFIVLTGCKDEHGRHDYLTVYEFDKYEHRISSAQQDVELRLDMSATPNLKVPEKWDWVAVRYYYGPTPETWTSTADPDEQKWADENVTFTQSHDKDGVLVVTVHVPENDSAMYRWFNIDATYGLDGAQAQIIQSPAENSKEVMRIRVSGQEYSSEYTLDDDGAYLFSDPEFAAMVARMESEDKWEMCVIESGIVDYVDMTRDDVDEYLTGLVSSAAEKTRSTLQNGFQYMKDTDQGYFALFSDSEFRGDNLYAGYDNFWYSYNLPNLKNWDMNDKVSSIAVAYNGTDPNICAILTVWDDADFNHGDTDRSKHRMSFIASYWNRQVTVTNLKDVKCINSSKSWNDRMSCISGHFGYWGRSMLNY